MGLFTPFYMDVTGNSTNSEKDRANRAVWALKNPKKLCKIARDAKFHIVRCAAVARLVDLGDEDALAVAMCQCDNDERRKIELAFKGLHSQAVLERIAKTAPSGNARAEAVKRLESETLLKEIALGDQSSGVRETATRRLTDSATLAKIALTDADNGPRCAAVANPHLTDPAVLAKVALETDYWRIRQNAILNPNFTDADALAKIAMEAPDCRADAVKSPHLTDPAVLAKIALENTDYGARKAAVEKEALADPEVLKKVALEDARADVRAAAVNKPQLKDPEVLKKVALEDADGNVRLIAVRRSELVDQAFLARIATEDADTDVRTAAVFRLENVDALAQIAETGEETRDYARWLAALKLSRRAPSRAVGPLVKLMVLDRDTSFSNRPLIKGANMTMMDLRQEAIHFLENQYRHTTIPGVREAISTLPSGNYGYLEYDHCSHDDQRIHFDIPR